MLPFLPFLVILFRVGVFYICVSQAKKNDNHKKSERKASSVEANPAKLTFKDIYEGYPVPNYEKSVKMCTLGVDLIYFDLKIILEKAKIIMTCPGAAAIEPEVWSQIGALCREFEQAVLNHNPSLLKQEEKVQERKQTKRGVMILFFLQ